MTPTFTVEPTASGPGDQPTKESTREPVQPADPEDPESYFVPDEVILFGPNDQMTQVIAQARERLGFREEELQLKESSPVPNLSALRRSCELMAGLMPPVEDDGAADD
ncbi:MAG: hypothetical protein H0V67_12610, partial [Geodermatophilaceae bacterium]|nr:hypothetical protein [Geodermatophilaceae bacterium]